MKKITEIEKIGKGARYRLFLDGELFGIFEAEILAKHCLKSGEEYDDMFFDELLIENGDYACFNRGLSGLEKSTKSEKMLQDYLKEKGITRFIINAGGNVVVGDHYNQGKYQIGIENPNLDGSLLTVVNANNISVVTSGSYERYYEYDGLF